MAASSAENESPAEASDAPSVGVKTNNHQPANGLSANGNDGGSGSGGDPPPPENNLPSAGKQQPMSRPGKPKGPGLGRRNTSDYSNSNSNKFQSYAPLSEQASFSKSEHNIHAERAGSGNIGTKQQAPRNKAARGVDPPETELPTRALMPLPAIIARPAADTSSSHTQSGQSAPGPATAMSAEQSARKARSRLIALQHRESHAGPPPPRDNTRKSNAGSVASGSLGSPNAKPRRRANSAGYVKSSSSSSIDGSDVPQTNMDPIESDEEQQKGLGEVPHSSSDSFYEAGHGGDDDAPRSPKPKPNNHQQHATQHPSSAPQRPTHRVPPHQLMQYLHAGGPRGSFGGAGGEQNLQGGTPVQRSQPPLQDQQRPLQPRQERQHIHPHSGGLTQPHQPNPNLKVMRKSADILYSDGIDILEKAASEAHEREEVDTLNDGINYLRKSLKQGTDSGGGMNDLTPPFPPPSGEKGARQHRPPPVANSSQGENNSGGDETSNAVMQHQHRHSQEYDQYQGAQHQYYSPQRTHRPPPPRNLSQQQGPLLEPTTSPRRRAPAITAAVAMDYIMSAGDVRPLNDNSDDDDNLGGIDVEEDINYSEQLEQVDAFMNTMIRQDEGNSSLANNAPGKMRILQKKPNMSFDSNAQSDNDSDNITEDGSAANSYDTDFEDNTSMSMHAEAKSKYAEDKYGPNKMSERINSLQLDDDSSLQQLPAELLESDKGRGVLYHNESQKSIDPPAASASEVDAESGKETKKTKKIGDTIASPPSVLPMRTMNERLYAVETVIPTSPRYSENGEVNANDGEVNFSSCEQDSTSSMPSSSRALLGPRNSSAGGITGVVLDVSKSQSGSSPSSQDSRMGKIDDADNAGVGHPFAHDPPQDGKEGIENKYSLWSGEITSPGSFDVDHGPDGKAKQTSTSLMMTLCSHLLPAMDNSDSLTNVLRIQSETSQKLVWDDDDPDEPGYIVHHLTEHQLASVESAFEKMANLLDRRGIEKFKSSPSTNAKDRNFERDLEEAELILDQEEKRSKSEPSIKRASTDESLGAAEGGLGMALALQSANRQDSDELRASVPEFPGIYPPGKGKAGEMECFYLPIITKSQKTGFEPTKDLVLKSGSVFANNYLVQSELGSAAFSTAYRCLDLSSEEDEDGYQDEVCLKVIKNTKDYFDQSLDEIKILQLLKDTGKVQENNIVEMTSYFYHREHLVIVTELLRQNLYEFGKSILESRGPLYFTRDRLSHITRQCLVALKFVHELGLMHCDIKPENILLSSYSRAMVKIIDFGSSSFTTDRQSSYIQSRSYRAPEVILGLPYGGKIDMWSLGCVVAEMYTNEVTFQNDSEISMLSRIEAICGPFPRHMIAKGRNSHRIFTDSGLIYEKVSQGDDESQSSSDDDASDKTMFHVYQPKMTNIAARLGFDEDFMNQPKTSEDDEKRALFVDFVSKLLTIDPDSRLSAEEALEHPWIASSLDLTEDEIRYG